MSVQRTCTTCHHEKNLEDFAKTGAGHRHICQLCWTTPPDLIECRKCGAQLPLRSFLTDPAARWGIRKTCRECGGNRYRKDPVYAEYVRAERRAAYRANPERSRAVTRAWLEQHPDYHKEYEKGRADQKSQDNRAWRQANAEHNRQRVKEWEKANPERMAVRNMMRRSRLDAAGPVPTRVQLVERFAEFGNACVYCGRDDCSMTPDHVIPLSRGGTNAIENIEPACRSCNCSKGTKTADEFRLYRERVSA